LISVGEADLDLLRASTQMRKSCANLTGRPADRAEADAEWNQRLNERSAPSPGLGYWLGWIDGEFVGWWGLGACPWDDTTSNLGYRLRRSYWGMGLATEGSRALLRHGLEAAGLDLVWASTTQRNTASQRVLENLGMRYVGIRFDQGQYEVRNAEAAPPSVAAVQDRSRMSTPDGIRTRATALRGRRARPLHNGGLKRSKL
jgi:RimJ/RimL family protein N-acetyltransferase